MVAEGFDVDGNCGSVRIPTLLNSPNLHATMLNDIPGIVPMETFESSRVQYKTIRTNLLLFVNLFAILVSH